MLKAKDDATNIIRDMNNIVNSSSSTTIKDLNNLRNNLNDSLKSVNKFDKDNSVSGDLTPYDLPKGTKVIVTKDDKILSLYESNAKKVSFLNEVKNNLQFAHQDFAFQRMQPPDICQYTEKGQSVRHCS